MAGASFLQLLTSGTGETHRSLGPFPLLGFFLNGVEMQINIDTTIRSNYAAFAARQWTGPEVHWIKRGNPLFSPWIRTPGAPPPGPDDPDPNNVVDRGSFFAYYDSPGPNPANTRYSGASRIQVVQNFTGWLEGLSIASGQYENLCDPVPAWFSVVDIADGNWDGSADGGSSWGFTSATTVGSGWRDVTAAPVI